MATNTIKWDKLNQVLDKIVGETKEEVPTLK